MKQIPFSPPFINQEVIEQVTNVLNSGWITTGPKSLELEILSAKYLGADHVVTCNSWSSGAQMVLKLLEIGPGDEVIVPNYTYAATLLAVSHMGATPVIVDVDDNYQIDFNAIASAINEKTKAIISVDIGGLPVDIDTLRKVVCNNAINFSSSNEYLKSLKRPAIISDAAHSFGAKIDDQYVGNQADFTVFSLHAVKNLTSAEGGLITFNLPKELGEQTVKSLKLIRLNGQTKDALAKTQNLANWEYDIVLKGFKMNMPDLCAAVAIGQLHSYDIIQNERERVYRRYYENLHSLDSITFLSDRIDSRESSRHLAMVSLKPELKAYRNDIIKVCSSQGVSTNVHFKPLSLMSAFKNEMIVGSIQRSIDLFEREISLPIYPQLTDEEIDFICKTLIDAIESVRN